MHEIFDAPEWLEALTLAERAALLAADEAGDPPSPEAALRTARKADRWRRETGLQDDGRFAARLADDGLTPERFLRLLAEPATGWRRRAVGRPDWLELLARVFSAPPPPLPLGVDESLSVLELLRPLIADAHARLLSALRRLAAESPGLLEPASLAADLLPTLVKRLKWASERTLALELQASGIEGRLQGETPEARFGSFVRALSEPRVALEILRRYPVLARDACRHAEQWVETHREMLERFAADREEIVRCLAGGMEPGPLVGAEGGLSDRHGGGRSVAILAFASGLRVVYKPKPLAVDRCFQELVAWLDERGAEPPLYRLAVLDRGSHGWVEHVAAGPCATPEEVERFFARQGAWAALFYTLEATDFHHENVIARGEHPVPIDLETLFQPARAVLAAGDPGYLPTSHTVLDSGLLPRRFWAGDGDAGLDLSGLGSMVGQSYGVRRIADEGTDRMRWAMQEARWEAGPNLPTLRGEPVALAAYGTAVLRGFRVLYRLLCRHRAELLAPEGPLAAFAGLRLRTLRRGTSSYVHLLNVGNHPDYLQNALDRDRLHDRLWLDAGDDPLLARAVRFEQAALSVGDVPLLGVLSTATDLLGSGDREGHRIAGFFATPGLARARSRLARMDEDDLERQGWLIEAAIEATRALDEEWVWPTGSLPEAAPASAERFLAMACRLGDRLARLAVEQGDQLTWFHLDLKPADGWRLEPMSTDLYGGLSGLALFFAYLGRLAGEERYERLARRALATVRQRLDADPGAVVRVGAFSGWGGILYTFTHLGLLWGEPGWLAAAEGLAAHLAAAIDGDQAFDLLAGAAGAAAALLAFHRHRPSPNLLALAVLCGDHLLAHAIVSERGYGWPPPDGGGRVPLTGFSHGAAGIAWALAGLAHSTGEERFRAAAEGALRYERSWFSPERDNWPDVRENRGAPGERVFLHAWCHGAPGIGLGRIGILPYFEDPAKRAEIRAEIRAAVRSTLAAGFGSNHSLCHGDLGNLELVREAGRVLQDPALTAEAQGLAARILARIEEGGPRWGASPRTESLGLLVGLAGIGYGLLRAADPERVPDVLLLETPAG